MIDQITVFLENEKGRLSALCRAVGEADVNMAALSVADTTDYGVVRIICSDPAHAREALEARGYRAIITRVSAVSVPNRPGGAAELLEVLDGLNVNIEYGYCFSNEADEAVMALKLSDAGRAPEVADALEAAGFHVYAQSELE